MTYISSHAARGECQAPLESFDTREVANSACYGHIIVSSNLLFSLSSSDGSSQA